MEQQDQAASLREMSQGYEEKESTLSNLPTRSEYQRKKRESEKLAKKQRGKKADQDKKKGKKQTPLITILVSIFLLLPLVIGLLYYYQVISFKNEPKKVEDSKYFEHVEFEKDQSDGK
ncbi:hypothetical protein [Bacillus andreraoultii]|uniref:hypothetical protein n=1 Tax=Bacillus andreraoultii TaxID=1499685 RepID=UPI00053B037E|nr:hypothetical protein [Bacillus andreraoultii]